MTNIPTVLVCIAIRDAYPNASDPFECPESWLEWLTGCTELEATAALVKAVDDGFAEYNERVRNGKQLTIEGRRLILTEFAKFAKAQVNG